MMLTTLLAAGCQPNGEVVSVLPDPTAPRWQAPRRPTPPKPVARYVPPTPGSYVSPEAGWIPAGGINSRWRCIVIHHSATERATPESMDRAHKARGWDELGYHFVIGNGQGYSDGAVFVGPRWAKQKHGAHCKTPGGFHNQHGIGISLMGNFEDHPPTHRQMESLARLIAFLQRQCHISESQILTHGGVTGKTACPGRHFSIGDLRRRLASYR